MNYGVFFLYKRIKIHENDKKNLKFFTGKRRALFEHPQYEIFDVN